MPCRLFVGADPGSNMSLDQPLPGYLVINLYEPPRIQKSRGGRPWFSFQTQVVAFDDDDARRREDGNAIRHRVLDCMVKAGRVYDCGVFWDRSMQTLHQLVKSLGIECERGAASVGGCRGIRHGS